MAITNFAKWIITPPGQPNKQEINVSEELDKLEYFPSAINEQKVWQDNYTTADYNDVWSMTDDPGAIQRLCSGINANTKLVYIPGCGSKTGLQKYITDNFPNIEKIICIDWSSEAVASAKATYSHRKIEYIVVDACNTGFLSGCFDIAILANCALSPNDLQNRRFLNETGRLLRPDGVMYGFFPTIFAALEISMLDDKFAYLNNGYIDIYKNSFFEQTQQLSQIFYTPLRLNQILNECGFTRELFEIYVCDSPHFRQESERIYGIPKDSGLAIWEIFLISKNARA